MSTENEGAAATPAAGPAPTSPAVQGPEGGRDNRTTELPRVASEAPASESGPASGAGPAAPADSTEGAGSTHEVTDSQGPRMSKPESTSTNSPDSADDPAAPGPGRPPQPDRPPHTPQSPYPDPAVQDARPSSGYGSGSSGYGANGGYGQWGAAGAGGNGDTAGGGIPPYGGPGGPGGPHNPWAAPPMPGPPPRQKRSGGLIAAAVVVALVAGGVGGGVGFWAAGRDGGSGTTTVSSDSDPKTLNRSPKSVAGIASKALPSVVTIQTAGGGEEGTGTGFVYDKQGHILTNNHVVASAADGGRVTATFSDGKKYDAEVIGNAQGYDIAVIKLKNAGDRKLDPLPLAESKDVAVGDATIAIGAPFGLSGTVTTGIVSAENRPVASSDGQGAQASYMNALQTDASINPGNSGGPLLNAQGAVIGVNSAIQSGGGGGMGGESQSGSVGLGFAIPVSQAQRVAGQLLKTGVPVYPVIGATVGMGEKGEGAQIAERGEGGEPAIPKDSPADKAGLKPGDVITKLDDTVIDSGPTLIGTIWTHKPGEKVELTYKRGGKESTVDVTLGSKKGDD